MTVCRGIYSPARRSFFMKEDQHTSTSGRHLVGEYLEHPEIAKREVNLARSAVMSDIVLGADHKQHHNRDTVATSLLASFGKGAVVRDCIYRENSAK